MELKISEQYTLLSKNLQIRPGIYLVDNLDQKIIINEDTKNEELEDKQASIKSMFADVTQVSSAEQIDAFISTLKFLCNFTQKVENIKLILWNNNLLHQKNGHFLHSLLNNSTQLKSLILDLGNNLLSHQGVSQIFQPFAVTLNNLSYLNLSVSFNKITDNSIDDITSLFVQTPHLVQLKFDIMNNNLSTFGLLKIINSFSVLQKLSLLDLNVMQNQRIEEDFTYIELLGEALSKLRKITAVVLHLYCPEDDIICAIQMMEEESKLIECLHSSESLRKLEILNFNMELDHSGKHQAYIMATKLLNFDMILEQRVDTGMDMFEEFEVVDKSLKMKYRQLIGIVVFQKQISQLLNFNPYFTYLDLYIE